MDEGIEVRLRGEGIRPGLVRSHELAEVLAAVEDLVIAETLQRDPTIRREDIVVGLYEIADESIGLRFKASMAAIAIPAFSIAALAIAAGDFQALSPQSLKPLQVLAGFSKRHGAIAELKIDSESLPLAEITPNTFIPQEAKITGATEIAAKVLRVGGKVPKAMLELQDGSVIYCEIPVERAIELGHRLYETAVFSGLATWSASTFELEEFSITGFSEFPRRDAVDTLAELRTLIGREFSKIRNVDEFVARLRRAEDVE